LEVRLLLYLPKFSVDSPVIVDEAGTKGIITSIEAVQKISKSKKSSYKVVYLVEIEGIGTKKFFEQQIKDVPEVLPENIEEIDKFLADSLLLAKHQFPDNKRVSNTINELLKIDTTGGETE
jgi:histidinol phosphatase-like enzyme